MKLDTWQKKILETKGHICLRSGRQCGKSTVISIKAGNYALSNANRTIMVISAVERQAGLLFEKILAHIHEKNKNMIKKPHSRNVTKTKINLINGTTIYCLPTGESGYGIRGFTIDLLIADEAAFINEQVWQAVTPMMATTKGKIILLSTPFGREGYFARCFQDEAYTKFHISSEDCSRIDKTFLEHEKKTMTKLQYQQEYMGEFVDDLMQWFPDDLIIKCQTAQRFPVSKAKDYYLGVDVGGKGADESTFEILRRMPNRNLIHVENLAEDYKLTTETERQILHLDAIYHFKRIYIDSTGVGAGIFDHLLENPQTKRRVVSIENAQRALDRDDKRHKKIMKEDLYTNLLAMMERGEIRLLDDPEVFQSLKSVQFEITESKDIKIFGKYTHIAEGLIRAAFSRKDKINKVWIR